MKKLVIILGVVFCIFTLKFVFVDNKIESEYELAHFEINEESDVERLKEDYHISEKKAQEISRNYTDYYRAYLFDTISNNSKIMLYHTTNYFSNCSEIFISKEMSESSADYYFLPSENTDVYVKVLIKKDAIEKLRDFKFSNVYLSFCGLAFSRSSFSGFTEVFPKDEIDEDIDYGENKFEYLKKKLLASFFSPENSLTEEFSMNKHFNNFSPYIRYNNKSIYAVATDEKKRYGITLFDADGNSKGGILISELLKSGTDMKIKTGETTYKDILKKYPNNIMFTVDKKCKTYHYFDDLTYIVITYEKNNGNFVVSDCKKGNYADIWGKLTDDDRTLICEKCSVS